jgi:hypothetical protein
MWRPPVVLLTGGQTPLAALPSKMNENSWQPQPYEYDGENSWLLQPYEYDGSYSYGRIPSTVPSRKR